MRNHITVTIAEQDYTLVAAEDEAYVRKVAAHVSRIVAMSFCEPRSWV